MSDGNRPTEVEAIYSAFRGRRRLSQVLAAILPGGEAARLFEHDAHVFRVLEAGQFGDALEGKVGFGQQLFHATQLGGANLRLWRAFEMLTEPPFQEAS